MATRPLQSQLLDQISTSSNALLQSARRRHKDTLLGRVSLLPPRSPGRGKQSEEAASSPPSPDRTKLSFRPPCSTLGCLNTQPQSHSLLAACAQSSGPLLSASKTTAPLAPSTHHLEGGGCTELSRPQPSPTLPISTQKNARQEEKVQRVAPPLGLDGKGKGNTNPLLISPSFT